jgi:heme/copper-type cytochrome/quinol oxidase subunit 2
MSTEQPENGPDSSLEAKILESTSSKLEALGWILLRWWGGIFRALFICAVGTIGYFLVDPQSISDMPLSQLTIKQIFENIFAVLIVIGCFRWFFDFPEQSGDKKPEKNPYVEWGKFGIGVIIVAVLAINWANK